MSPADDLVTSSGAASVRLDKLSGAPSTIELDFALAQAQQNASAIIELPWRTATNSTFVLKVSLFEGEDGPRWSLFKGETADAAVVWSFDSDDTSLIESLIAAECSNERGVVGTEKNGAVQNMQATAPPSPVVAPDATAVGVNSGAGAVSSLISQPRLPEPVPLDPALLQEVEKTLLAEATGIATRGAFFYFVVREFARYQALKAPYAVMIFEMWADYGGGKRQALPERALKEALTRLTSGLRPIDMLAHYADHQFACILPGLISNQAIELGRVLERQLAGAPLQPGLDANQVQFFAGVASIPDTCDHPGIALAAAAAALNQAKERKTSLVLFPSATRAG